jgi:hypothetical protein
MLIETDALYGLIAVLYIFAGLCCRLAHRAVNRLK